MPACIVMAIRKTFPEESGNYMGFREVDLELCTFSAMSFNND